MSLSKGFAWVTHAFSNKEAEQAIVLGRSFCFKTTGVLVVVFNEKVRPYLKTALESTFHLAISKEENWRGWKQCPSVLGLIIASILPNFEKIVFLEPSCMALQDPDNLFFCKWNPVEVDEKGAGVLLISVTEEQKKTLGQVENFLGPVELFVKEVIEIVKGSVGILNSKSIASLGLDSLVIPGLLYPYNLSLVHLSSLDEFLYNLKASDCLKSKENMQPLYLEWLKLYEESKISDVSKISYISGSAPEPIAIVGLACRFPKSNNEIEFWRLLKEGGNGIQKLPEHRWTKKQYGFVPPEAEKIEAGFLSTPIDQFDAKFFEISPKEAVIMDPQHKLGLEVVWESFENAGINPQNLKGEHGGVFFGTWIVDFRELVHSATTPSSQTYPNYKGNCVASGAARLSHLLGWTGPCIGTESDCSAGLTSVHLASKSLANGECKIAVAYAANILARPCVVSEIPFCSGNFRCKTFDESADGFARAEGVAALILKNYSDAVRDGDRIRGLIRGSAINHEGMSSSIGTPTTNGQVQVMKLALKDAKIDPSRISYVESHGTGTAVGDPIEMTGIGKVYGHGSGRDDYVIVGSVKTNVGHTESCSGITGLIKVILSMENELIPVHLNFTKLNPKINLEELQVCLPLREPIPWPKVTGKTRLAGVSSYGVTGNNCHLVLEEPESKDVLASSTKNFLERPLHIMKVTAKSAPALSKLLEKYKSVFNDANFADLAHSANVGRANFNVRTVLIAEDNESALKTINLGKLQTNEGLSALDENISNLCFLFTGQGSQYHGMAKQLYSTSPVFRVNFDFCNEWLCNRYNISIKAVYWEAHKESEEAHKTLFSQTGIFVVEYCLLKLWQSLGVKPKFVLGHSLGEFCAAVCAGILDIEDALTLVAERSRLIDQLPSGKMLVVKASKDVVDKLQFEHFKNPKEFLDYAAINTNEQTVVAGCPENIKSFEGFLKNNEIKCTMLQSTHAFHSKNMDPMLEEYRKVAERIQYGNGSSDCIFISGMLGTALDADSVNANYWVRHARDQVNFLSACKLVTEELNCSTFLELGPHPVLSALLTQNCQSVENPIVCLPSLRRNAEDWKTLLSSVGKLFVERGVDIDWAGFDRGYKRQRIANLLPTYPFQKTTFWPKVDSNPLLHSSKHILLGSRITNPTDTAIFQSKVSPEKELKYLKDHLLENRILFPGAGYFEMMLAAGATYFFGDLDHHFQHPTRPIQLTNLKIHSPLQLDENGSNSGVFCQTTLKTTREEMGDKPRGFSCAVYHLEEEDDNPKGPSLKHHASATFLPNNSVGNSNDEHLQELLQFYNQDYNMQIISTLKSQDGEDYPFQTLYEQQSKAGLHLGESFRALRKIWKDSKVQQVLIETAVPENSESYLLHPILIDAMIQVACQSKIEYEEQQQKTKRQALRVPVGCQRFIWMQPLRTQNCFIYCPDSRFQSALLFDETGALISLMYNVELAETNLEAVKGALDNRHKSQLKMFCHEWKKTSTLPLLNFLNITNSIPDLVEFARKEGQLSSVMTAEECKKREAIKKLVSLYTLRAFYILGWKPQTGNRFTIKQLIKNLNILEKQNKLFKHLFRYLMEDGLLNRIEAKETVFYATSGVVNSLDEVEEAIKTLENNPSLQSTHDFELIKSVGEKLDKLFTGEESVFPLIYPNEASTSNYFEEQICKISPFCKDILKQRCQVLKEAFNQTGGPLPTLHILEIGAGSGAASGIYMESLQEAGIPFQFVFTDASPQFFSVAKKKFGQFEKMMKFKALDVEQEPTSQGFPPNYFDIVIASNTLYKVADIEGSLHNIRKLLADGGNLLLRETMKVDDRMINLCVGLMEEFWRFADFHRRPDHCMLTAEKWQQVLKDTGFLDVHIKKYGEDETYGMIACRADKHHSLEKVLSLPNQNLLANKSNRIEYECPKWLIFYKNEGEIVTDHLLKYFNFVGIKQVKLIEVSEESEGISKITEQVSTLDGIIVTWGLISSEEERDQEKLAKPYLNLLQTLVKFPPGNKVPTCILLSNGLYPVGDTVCPNPSPSTLIGMSLTALNEYQELKLKVMDLDPDLKLGSALWQAFQEIFNGLDETDPTLVSIFRGGNKLSPKLTVGKPPTSSLALPCSSNRYQLELPQSKLIQDLTFRPLESFYLKESEIEVKTICSALNFRDLLSIWKPTKYFENINQVGCDFAGEVISVGSSITNFTVGDKVFGVIPSNHALPSHIKIKAEFVQKVPPSFTLAEAACMPIVFSTAYHSLINVAHAQSGETILIHTASGGVGLVAIQIAKHLGLQIICTAGNERKRSYLRSLGISHVFNSRTLEFSKQILEVTKGKGVDIVLNSITGPGFKEASLEATAKKGGRFLEMSKLNIWTEKDVTELRPDVAYSIIDISQEGEEFAIKVLKPLMNQLGDWMWNGKLNPIPYTRYDIGDIRDALGYLQKAKHIGKIICAAPTQDLLPSAQDTSQISLFNERSAYLITGGLGGIGMEVCKWMMKQGASHILLVGRSPPTPQVWSTLEFLRKEYNGKIYVLQGDVGNWESCKGIFQKISSMKELPPLRGVMHAAGTLSDAILQNLTWEDFQKIFQSKVDGSWNLHELTKEMPLEHFVMFSSLSSMIGTPGQAPYVAANFFQDTLAHFRKSRGLPATTVNWGQWGEVGLARDMKFRLVLPLTPQQCIGALDLVMRKNMSAVTVASFRDNLESQIEFHSYIKWIVDPKIVRQTINASSKVSLNNSQVNSAKFLDEYETCGKSLDDKTNVVRTNLKTLLRIVLHMNEEEEINEDEDLSILGMDSLMMIELFNLMQGLCGKKITLSQSAIRECKTLRDLVTCFVKLLEEKWEEAPAPSTQDVMKQSLLDVILPPDIQVEVEGSHVAPSQIKRLLLTGATGFVGSHILKELLETTNLQKIYCLVRGKDPKTRLLSVLEKHHIFILDDIFQNRVSVISGDFALPMLGLSEKEYLSLSQEIEAILNAGAMVHHYEYYKTIPNSSKDIRSVNVGGLLNLLRFASKTQTKHLFHISSLLTVFEIGEDDRLLEAWPSVQSLANMGHNMGYPVSKMINELHIKESVEDRGIPAKVLRLTNLRSSTFYGKSFTKGDHFLKLLLFCLKEGIVPDLPGPANFIPVDVASKLIIGIIFQDNVPNEGFNISRFQPPALFQGIFEKIGEELGFPVKKEAMNLEEFRTLVVQICREAKKEFEQTGDTAALRKAILYEFQLFYEKKDLFQYAMHMIYHGDSFDERQLGEDYWTSKKLMKYIPNLYCQIEDVGQVLKRDLRVAMKEEFPDLFGNGCI